MAGSGEEPSGTRAALRNPSRVNRVIAYVQRIADLRGAAQVRRGAAVALLTWVPMHVIASLAHWVVPNAAGTDDFSWRWSSIVGAILLIPLAETYGMRLVFLGLRKFTQRPLVLAVVSAVIWGLVHLGFESRGLHAAWGFFVMSVCYLSLEKLSVRHAMIGVTAIHATCNGLSYLICLPDRLLGT